MVCWRLGICETADVLNDTKVDILYGTHSAEHVFEIVLPSIPLHDNETN